MRMKIVRRKSPQPVREPFIMWEGEEPKVKVEETQPEARMKRLRSVTPGRVGEW